MNFQPYAINQSQLIGTFAPEQILKGKVMELLPDRTALVQLGANQIVAKVAATNPPLAVGQEYLFQIQQQGTFPLIAKLIERNRTGQQPAQNMADDVFQTLKLPEDALSRQIVQSFLERGDPLTRANVLQARALLSGSSNVARDLPTVQWLLNRHLPLTKAFFEAAKAFQASAPLSESLETLYSQIREAHVSNASVARLGQTLATLVGREARGEAAPAAGQGGAANLAVLFTRLGGDKSAQVLQSFVNSRSSQLPGDARQQITAFLNSAMDEKAAAVLLKGLKIDQPSQAFLAELRSFVSGQVQEAASGSTAPNNANALMNVFKQLGFNYEYQVGGVINQELGRDAVDGLLKGQLLAVVQDQTAPHAIRHLAGDMLNRITGEQLQMVSADPYVAQFALQLPLPFKNEMTEVSVYWEGKRNRKGALNPDSCTIVLWLELAHLKETLVNIHVQNRAVTINVQNDSADLRPLLAAGEGGLKERLADIGYELLSLSQSEEIDKKLEKKVRTPLTETNYRLDVKV